MGDSAGGINGLAVGLTGVGLLLVTSAIRNQPVADTLRWVLQKPTSGKQIGTPIGSLPSNVRTVDPASVVAPAVSAVVAGVAAGSVTLFLAAAERYLGVPYVYGGTSKSGIDCSGLVVASLRDVGIKAPRFTTLTFDSWAKGQGATRVTPDQFAAGDIICRPGHMAIALSNTTMIAAPHVGTVVKHEDIYSKSTWWGWRLFK